MEASGSSRKRHAGPANNVPDTSTSLIPLGLTNIGNKSYIGGGLKDTLHGVRYQLHLLMLILWRANEQNYDEFCLTSELTEAEKFDDVVFVSESKNSKRESRLLQVKHTKNVITSEDLFIKKGKKDKFYLPKYFNSFTKIKERCSTESYHSVLSGSEIKDVILITNATYDGAGLKDCLEEINIEPDKLLNIPQNSELKTFKLKKLKDNMLLQGHNKSQFANVSDFNDLIKLLVDPKVKQIEKTHKVFMEYYYALMRDVFEKDKKNMRFSQKFIDGTNLPKEVQEFRKHVLSEKESNMELKDFNWKITDGLAKEFQPEENPTIVDPPKFAQQFHNILKYFEKLVEINEDNVAKVFQDSNGTSLSEDDRKTFIANIRNLGGHVLITKFSEIRFSTSFIRSTDQDDEKGMNAPECKKKTLDDLDTFRSELKRLIDFKLIDQYIFEIGFKFQTCEEGAFERKLPKPFSEDDLNDFFDKFKIIFNYPDQLDEILGNEIKEKHKSLDCKAFKSICETDLHRWLAARMTTFYTPEKAKSLFNGIEDDIFSMELNGFNESYFANIPMKYQFKPIVHIQDFLQNGSENCLKLRFEYFGLGPTRVVQTMQYLYKHDTIEEIRKYTRRYGFIFMTTKQLNNKKFFKKISDGKKRWNLLIIECEKDGAVNEIDQIYDDYQDYFSKMIFMTQTNGEKISTKFTDLTDDSQANLYKNAKLRIYTEELKIDTEELNIDTIENELNAKLIIDPEIGEFNFSEAIDKMDQNELIDADTLQKLIEGQPVKIENKIRDTDPIVHQYYIERYVARLEEKYSEDEFVKNAEPMVIVSDIAGCGKSSLLSSLSRKILQYNKRVWLFRIDLNDHTEFLDLKSKIVNSINTPDEMVQFLLEMLEETMTSTFERNLFKNCLLKPTTLKFAFFFDGFDEISPDYKEVVLELLVQLQESRDIRVFVTTRPSMVECLEEKLKLNAYTISPLSETDVTDSLFNFAQPRVLNMFKTQCHIPQSVHAIFKSYCSSFLEWGVEHISNPLHLRMILEVFDEKFVSSSKFIDLLDFCINKVNGFDLYEKFIERKLRIHCTEKEHLNLSNLAIRDDQKEFRSLIETKHQYLALFEIYNSDQLSKLLSPEEIEKAKSFIEEVRNGKERRGLVDRVVNNKPRFIHRSYAEYFLACFMANSLINGKEIEFLQCIQYIGIEETFLADVNKIRMEENTIPEESLRKLKCAIFNYFEDFALGKDVLPPIINILRGFDSNDIIKMIGNEIIYEATEACNWFKLDEMVRIQKELIEDKSKFDKAVEEVVNTDKWEDMPMVFASVLHFNLEPVICLMEHRADLTARNKDGQNALEFAAFVDKPEIYEWLATIADDGSGADIHMEAEEAQDAGINVKDNEDGTPMDL